jgi:hypothetical protein
MLVAVCRLELLVCVYPEISCVLETISYRAQSVASLNQGQAPSSSSQPKLLDYRNIPLDRHLATLATQTKGGVRLSLPGLHVCNWALD